MSKHNWKYCSQEESFITSILNSVLCDKIDFGDLDEDPGVTKEVKLVEDDTAKTKSEPLNMSTDVIRVKVVKAFGTMQYYGYNRFILPVLKSQNCVGLLGLKVSANSNSIQGRILVRLRNNPQDDRVGSTAEQDMLNLIQLLRVSWGMPQKAIYKWRDMVPKGEGFSYRKNPKKPEKMKMLAMDAETKAKELTEARAIWKPFEERVTTAPRVVELTDRIGKMVDIELTEDLPFEDINNVTILLGDQENEQEIKSLFNDDCLQKFLTEAETCKTSTSQKLSHSQFCKSSLEVFKYLCGGIEYKDMVKAFPSFGNEFRRIRSAWNHLEDLNLLQETLTKQCDHCGKTFSCHTTTLDGQNISLHMKKCKLEKANCDCGLTFSSPKEKRHHMLVKHSGVAYLECGQCHYVTKVQSALDNHVEYFHGFPGREEVCDLSLIHI